MSERFKLNLLKLIDDLPDESPLKVPLRNGMETVVAETLNTNGSTSVALMPTGIINIFTVGVVSKPHPDLIRRAIGSDGVANL